MAVVRVTLFRAHPGQEDALARQLRINVREVRAAIPNILDISTGPKTGGTGNFNAAIVAKYPDQAALDAYDIHPAHLDTRSRMEGYVAERQTFVYEIWD